MPPVIAVGPRGDGPFSARPYTDQDAMNTLLAHGGMGCLRGAQRGYQNAMNTQAASVGLEYMHASMGADPSLWQQVAQNARNPDVPSPPEPGITWTRTGGRTWRVVVTR